MDSKGETLLDALDADSECGPLKVPSIYGEDGSDAESGGACVLVGEGVDGVQVPADTYIDADRVAELFKSMPTHRKTLLSILEFCTEKQKVPEVIKKIDDLLRNNFSVYKATRFCSLLEQAGALLKVTEDGTDYADAKVQPILIEEDGVEYYKAGEPPEAFWVTTKAGCHFLEADDPLERFRESLESQPAYHPIYTQILLFCSNEEGRGISEIGDAFDDDPLLQEPRIYARYFVDILEKCDALTWDKKWKTTSIGQLGIEEIRSWALVDEGAANG
jgi:hypothetical protein